MLELPFVDGIRRRTGQRHRHIYLRQSTTTCCGTRLAEGVQDSAPALLHGRSVRRGSPHRPASPWALIFFPAGDNVEQARKSGVSYIAEPGGSIGTTTSSDRRPLAHRHGLHQHEGCSTIKIARASAEARLSRHNRRSGQGRNNSGFPGSFCFQEAQYEHYSHPAATAETAPL